MESLVSLGVETTTQNTANPAPVVSHSSTGGVASNGNPPQSTVVSEAPSPRSKKKVKKKSPYATLNLLKEELVELQEFAKTQGKLPRVVVMELVRKAKEQAQTPA